MPKGVEGSFRAGNVPEEWTVRDSSFFEFVNVPRSVVGDGAHEDGHLAAAKVRTRNLIRLEPNQVKSEE